MSTTGADERLGISVTAVDLANPADSGTMEIMDDYCLIAAGSCHVTYTQVSAAKDGTETHVVTIKGIRR